MLSAYTVAPLSPLTVTITISFRLSVPITGAETKPASNSFVQTTSPFSASIHWSAFTAASRVPA